MPISDSIVNLENPILITGAGGFIGLRLIDYLQDLGFTRIRCLVRGAGSSEKLRAIANKRPQALELIKGNLLSKEDCALAAKDVAVIYHLAAGTGTKSFADAFLNSVVTTRNLLDASLRFNSLKRFVNVSSFSVYSNANGSLLDESSAVESQPHLRDAYCFAKVKQDALVEEYGKKYKIPYVLVRPGVVYGPGKKRIHGRIGLGTFGIFLHLGGSNRIPFTHVDNCAAAIALAGIKKGVDGEVFNVVDNELPTSRQFLRMYKKEVDRFSSIYVPHFASYLLCLAWEKYSTWSSGQLPPAFSRREWTAYWKPTRYSNEKIKTRLSWTPRISTAEGLAQFFENCRKEAHA